MSALQGAELQRLPVALVPISIGRPAMLSLTPGVMRAFGSEDIGEAGLLTGWAATEAGHAWNDGVDATLLIATRRQPGSTELELFVEPYVTRQNPMQDLTLYVNGARAGYWRMQEREVTRLVAWIDPSWWREVHDRAVLRLVFHMPQSASPAQLGDGFDLRQLGLSFRSIALLTSSTEA